MIRHKYKILLIPPWIILFFDFYAGVYETGSKIRAYLIGTEIIILLVILTPNVR